MRKNRYKQLIPVLSISSMLLISGCSAAAQQTFNQDAVIAVEVSNVQKEFITTGEVYTGLVKPNAEISIIPKFGGKVAELPVEVGTNVKKGQVLLKLDDSDLQNSLKQATAAEAAAKAGIDSAEMGQQSGVVQSETGAVQARASMVSAKNSMIQAEDNLTKAANAVKQAENAVKTTELALTKTEQALKDATTNHNRMKQLYAQSAISKAELEKSETALVTAQANYDSTKLENTNAKTSLATAQKANEGAKKTYENASTGYQTASEGHAKAQEQIDLSKSTASVEASKEALNQAQVGVEVAQDMLDDAVITSPIDGMIGVKNTDVGEMVSTQSPALVVVDLEKVRAVVYVPATEINTVKQGDLVQVKAVSFNYVTTGTVKTISPLDEGGKGYPVEIEIANPDLSLKSGMAVDLQFIEEDAPEGMLIPASAVSKEDGKSYVYVVKKDHPKRQEIEVGEKKGSMVNVTKGITEDDLVITTNLPVLSDDVKISYK